MVLVNRIEEFAVVDGVRHDLSTNFYPGAVHPDGYQRSSVPARSVAHLDLSRRQRGQVERTLFMPHGRQTTVVLAARRVGRQRRARLFVRPLLSGRDYHALHHENDVAAHAGRRRRRAGDAAALPDAAGDCTCTTTASTRTGPSGIGAFQYPEERERGLDFEEDLFSPGELQLDLGGGTQAVAIFTLEPPGECPTTATALRTREHGAARARRRRTDDGRPRGSASLASSSWCGAASHRTVDRRLSLVHRLGPRHLHRAAGPALAGGWRELARDLLRRSRRTVQDGLIPNRFPDDGGTPEYNSVDAPLWYVWLGLCAGHARRARQRRQPARPPAPGMTRRWRSLLPAVRAIIDGYLARHAATTSASTTTA